MHHFSIKENSPVYSPSQSSVRKKRVASKNNRIESMSTTIFFFYINVHTDLNPLRLIVTKDYAGVDCGLIVSIYLACISRLPTRIVIESTDCE